MNGYKLQSATYYWDLCDDFGSWRLFCACWNQYKSYLHASIDNPKSDIDVIEWLETIADEKVNNPKSVFYIYG